MALDGLIGNTAYNFEYPITLIGSSIDDFVNNSKSGHSNSALASHIVEMYETNKSNFANILVKIHPLCVVYADRVFIHFEYFNLISSQWGNPVVADYKYDEPIPLFLITNDYMLKACLKSVFETVKKILKCADSHFCKHCRASKADTCLQTIDDEGKQGVVISSIESCNKSVDKFIEDGFCFNKTLYATRVITSHINYLDKYRAYIWNTKLNDKEQLNLWQTILLNQISEYIDFWNNRDVKDNEHLWIIKYRKSLEKSTKDMNDGVFSPIMLN